MSPKRVAKILGLLQDRVSLALSRTFGAAHRTSTLGTRKAKVP